MDPSSPFGAKMCTLRRSWSPWHVTRGSSCSCAQTSAPGQFWGSPHPQISTNAESPLCFNVLEQIFNTLRLFEVWPCFYHTVSFSSVVLLYFGYFFVYRFFHVALTPFPGLSGVLSCHEPEIICSLGAPSPR